MSVYGKDDVEFFRTALESVTIKQHLSPAQVVIVQDGPVPQTIELVIQTIEKKVSDIEFTIVRKEQNEGLAVALNEGLKACKYEWVARMDSDDISTPNRFEKQVDYILRVNNHIDVLGGHIDEFTQRVGDIHSVRKVGLSQSEIFQMAKKRTPMNHVSVMYKKSIVEYVGGYSVSFGKLEDYKLWVDLLTVNARMANVDDVLVHVRVGNGFIERRSNAREIEDWDMLQAYLLKGNFISKRQALLNKCYIRIFIHLPPIVKKIMYKTVLRK